MDEETNRAEKAKRRQAGVEAQKARRDAKLKNALRDNLRRRKQKARVSRENSDEED